MNRSSRSSSRRPTPSATNVPRPNAKSDNCNSPTTAEQQPVDDEPPTGESILKGVYCWFSKVLGPAGKKVLRVSWVTGLILALAFGVLHPFVSSICDQPIVSDTTESLFGPPLPQASSSTLTVVVAGIDGDDGSAGQLVIAALERAHIHAVPLGRHIRVPVIEECPAMLDAEKHAQDFLAKTGAQVLVWGKLLHAGSQPAGIELHYTLPPNVKGYTITHGFYAIGGNEIIAVQFQQDLVTVINNLVQAEEERLESVRTQVKEMRLENSTTIALR
jgi:hypothetical protein